MANNKTLEEILSASIMLDLQKLLPLLDVGELRAHGKKDLFKAQKSLLDAKKFAMALQKSTGDSEYLNLIIKKINEEIELILARILGIEKRKKRIQQYNEEYDEDFQALVDMELLFWQQKALLLAQDEELKKVQNLFMQALALSTTSSWLLIQNRKLRAEIENLPLLDEQKKPILEILDHQEIRLNQESSLAHCHMHSANKLAVLAAQPLSEEQRKQLIVCETHLQHEEDKLASLQAREMAVIKQIEDLKSIIKNNDDPVAFMNQTENVSKLKLLRKEDAALKNKIAKRMLRNDKLQKEIKLLKVSIKESHAIDPNKTPQQLANPGDKQQLIDQIKNTHAQACKSVKLCESIIKQLDQKEIELQGISRSEIQSMYNDITRDNIQEGKLESEVFSHSRNSFTATLLNEYTKEHELIAKRVEEFAKTLQTIMEHNIFPKPKGYQLDNNSSNNPENTPPQPKM